MSLFNDIKVGDQVIVDPPSYKVGRRSVCKVEKVTTTQFTAGGFRFNKRNGWEIGGYSYRLSTAKAATPDLIAQVEAEHRYRNAQHALRNKLNSIEELWREIDRNHGSHQWAATLEAALSHLTAAAEVLKVRQEDLHDSSPGDLLDWE